MSTLQRIEPGPGQESVWDYPRPPAVERSSQHIRVIFNGEVIADTHCAVRVLETSHPPVYYIPPADIKMDYLSLTTQHSVCEFKGQASYYNIRAGDKAAAYVAWYYPRPQPGYEVITNYVAFYPSKVDACYVDDEQAQPQEGDFYGGWITNAIVGPFKGGVGTMGW